MRVLSKVYSVLEAPALHNAAQKILSLGKGTQVMAEGITALFRPQKHERVLDMGCGTGRYANLFDCRYVGVDLSLPFLQYGLKQKTSPEHFFVQANIEDWAFQQGAFDYVLCVGVIHHLPAELAASLLENFKRVLKKGGRAFILEPIYPQNRWNFAGHVLFSLDRGRFTRTKPQLDPVMRASGFSESALQIPASKTFPSEVRTYEYHA